jgi:hypothetical protein
MFLKKIQLLKTNLLNSSWINYMFYTKKNLLTTAFSIFLFSHISALNVQDADIDPFFATESTSETNTNTTTETTTTNSIDTFDTQPYNFSYETDTEKIVSYTTTYEDRIILDQDCFNKETGDWEHGKMQLYPDISLMNEGRQSFDVSLDLNINNQNHSNTDTTHNSHSLPTQQDHDVLANKLTDDTLDCRRQESESTHVAPSYIQHNNIRAIQRQKALEELNELHNFSSNPKEIFASPNVQAYFKQFKYDLIEKYRDKKVFFFSKNKTFPTAESEIKFANALSTKVGEYLYQIKHTASLDLKITAFNELKALWVWKRDHTFLTTGFINGTGEDGFVARLGIDLMHIAERDLISQPDYIAQYADPESLKVIQDFREKCIALQQKGDRYALLNEKLQLQQELFKNGKNDNLTTNICYAIVEKIYSHSITNILYDIVHTKSLERAHNQLLYLEMQILDQARKHNIALATQIKDFILKQYDFDLIEAAYNCYISRADYIKTVNDQPLLLNNNLSPILDSIKHKPLPVAHAELVHLQKQIAKTFESFNITDTAIQKEVIIKKFGIDILEQASNAYKNRSDHKELINSFMDIDVNQAATKILENNNSYESVANEMSDLAQHVFGNAHLCNLRNLPSIESHVYDSIDAMRIAQDHPTFIFNFSMAHRTLGDIQQLAHAVLSGTHPVLERSSELLTIGFSAFFKGLNPVTQAANMGHLALTLGSFLKKSGTALWNDPITVMHNGMNSTCTLIDLIRNTADFTSDLTVGKLYLSPEEYKQRTDTFCKMIEPLQGVSAEHCFEFIGQLTADILFMNGLGCSYTFLKEIDALGKIGGSAARVARIFKNGFDTHLANNPIMVTAEGVTIKMSEAMHNLHGSGGKNIINSSKALLESVYAPIAANLKTEIELLKKIELPYGFAEFSQRRIKIAYEHILGMKIDLTKRGKIELRGFHHDYKNAIENSKAIDFVDKVANEYGYYSAQLCENGNHIKDASFFPAEWSRKQVADKICEAYDSFIKNGAIIESEKSGKYLINGLTKEGIKIEMYITKAGEITTAYPKLK